MYAEATEGDWRPDKAGIKDKRAKGRQHCYPQDQHADVRCADGYFHPYLHHWGSSGPAAQAVPAGELY